MEIISSRYHPDRFSRPEREESGAAFTEKCTPEFWAIRECEGRLWPEVIEGGDPAATARQAAREKSGDGQ